MCGNLGDGCPKTQYEKELTSRSGDVLLETQKMQLRRSESEGHHFRKLGVASAKTAKVMGQRDLLVLVPRLRSGNGCLIETRPEKRDAPSPGLVAHGVSLSFFDFAMPSYLSAAGAEAALQRLPSKVDRSSESSFADFRARFVRSASLHSR